MDRHDKPMPHGMYCRKEGRYCRIINVEVMAKPRPDNFIQSEDKDKMLTLDKTYNEIKSTNTRTKQSCF